MILAIIFCTVYLVLFHIVLGTYNQISIGFIASWLRHTNRPCSDQKLLLKYIKSCRSLRVAIGSFGYYKNITTLQIVGKLVTYTVKLLMLTKDMTYNSV